MKAKEVLEKARNTLQVGVMAAKNRRQYIWWVYQDVRGEWRWRFIAPNGRILADSGEGYKRREACLRGMRTVGDGCYWDEIIHKDDKVKT